MRVPTFLSAGRTAGIVVAPLALALLAQPASAQWHAQQQQQYPQQQYPQQRYPQQSRNNGQYSSGQRELFEWQGMVDKEIRVQMAGNRASVMPIGNNERGLGNARAMSGIPGQNGYVTVSALQGRGQVDVVQQPTAQNGYVTIVRVRDPQSGASPYRIAAYWQPNGNSGYNGGQIYNDNSRGNGRGKGRGNGHAYGHRDRNDQNDQGNDRGNHKDNGLHRGQTGAVWPYPVGH